MPVVKMFEVRDRATFIPIIAVQMGNPANEAERYLNAAAAYGSEHVIVYNLLSHEGHYDPFCGIWKIGRTMIIVHNYIVRNFDSLESGDVLDVEYILGERPTKKISQRLSREG